MRHKYMNVIVIRHLYVLLLHLRREGACLLHSQTIDFQ